MLPVVAHLLHAHGLITAALQTEIQVILWVATADLRDECVSEACGSDAQLMPEGIDQTAASIRDVGPP